MEEQKRSIRAFLAPYFRGRELADDEDIYASGVINSLLAMQLVMFVEKEFGLTVEDEDLEMDNFRTVDAVASFVGRKGSGR
jgi:acyl carrier protein